MACRSEDISVNLFPTVLIAQVSFHVVHFLIFAVPRIILPKGSHQDHRYKPHEENHHHKTVEDAEPVDL